MVETAKRLEKETRIEMEHSRVLKSFVMIDVFPFLALGGAVNRVGMGREPVTAVAQLHYMAEQKSAISKLKDIEKSPFAHLPYTYTHT